MNTDLAPISLNEYGLAVWRHKYDRNLFVERSYFWCDRLVFLNEANGRHLIGETTFSSYDFTTTDWVPVTVEEFKRVKSNYKDIYAPDCERLMNKELFKSTLDLPQEFHQYVEETAVELARQCPTMASVWGEYQAKAEDLVKWSSWVVSASRRTVAYHISSSVLDSYHKISTVTPTTEVATQVIARHIAKRACELTNSVCLMSYKLRFQISQRLLVTSDLDPSSDDETSVISAPNKETILQLAQSFFKAYYLVGVVPPALEILGFDASDSHVETNAVVMAAQLLQSTSNAASDLGR